MVFCSGVLLCFCVGRLFMYTVYSFQVYWWQPLDSSTSLKDSLFSSVLYFSQCRMGCRRLPRALRRLCCLLEFSAVGVPLFIPFLRVITFLMETTKIPVRQYPFKFVLSFIFYPHFNIHVYVHIVCNKYIPVVYKIYYYTHTRNKIYNKGISLYQYRVTPNTHTRSPHPPTLTPMHSRTPHLHSYYLFYVPKKDWMLSIV